MPPTFLKINNAGYFYEPVERVTDGTVNLAEDSKMIEICAVGVLRVSSTLITEGLLSKNGKIAIITSQAGSLEWRKDQNPHGDNYGHHMSRAACNMMGLLLSYELKEQNVPVALVSENICFSLSLSLSLSLSPLLYVCVFVFSRARARVLVCFHRDDSPHHPLHTATPWLQPD